MCPPSGPVENDVVAGNDPSLLALVRCDRDTCYGKMANIDLLRCIVLFRFADCIIDTHTYSLSRNGESQRLSPKVFQVLHYLLIHRERVITKQELSEQIWPDLFVSDGTMETTISAVRRAVGDSGRAQRIIRTLPGHGYQFIESVEVEAASSEADGRMRQGG